MKKHEKYKDSGVPWIGEIPKDWKVEKLKRVLIIQKDISVKNNPVVLSLARDGVKVRDISSNEGQIASTYENYNLVKRGDLLLNPMDLISGANCSYSYVYGVISPAYFNLRAHKGYHTKYYDYFFKVQYWTLALFAHGKGVSKENRWTLNTETLKQYYVLTSSYSEQRKITDYLDYNMEVIDKVISEKQRLIKKLKEYRQAIINEAVTKGLDKNTSMKNSGVDWIGEIPKDWDIKRLKNIGIFTRGSGIKKDDVNNEGIQCIRYGEIYTKYNHSFRETTSFVSEDIAKNCLQVSIDDILITLTGETKEDIGKAIVYLGDGRLVAGGDLAVLKCTNNNPSYVTYFLNAEISKLQKENLAVGEIIVHIGTANLQKIIIPLPDKSLQDKIVLFLDKKTSIIEATISNINLQITNLQEYKKSIISEAVTGKIKIEKYINEGVI